MYQTTMFNNTQKHPSLTTNKERSFDEPYNTMQAAAVRMMLQQGHAILVAQERQNSKRTYRSFPSMHKVHQWMSTLPDKLRNIYMVDLSAWSNETLTPEEQCVINNMYVSPLVCDVEWLSVDHTPDPLASNRMATLETVIRQVLGQFITGGGSIAVHTEELSRLPVGKTQFKNSFHLVVPSAVFKHNAEGCMKDFVLKILVPKMQRYKDMLWVDTAGIGDVKCIVDLGIYTRSRQLRMSGCCKYGGIGLVPASLAELQRMRSSYYVPDLDPTTIVITEAMVLMNVDPLEETKHIELERTKNGKKRRKSEKNDNKKKDKKKEKENRQNKKKVKIGTENRESVHCQTRHHAVADSVHCAELTAMIRSKGDYTSQVVTAYKSYCVVTLDAPRMCVVGHTVHKHNTAKLTVDERTGMVWFFCYSSKCPDAVCIGQLNASIPNSDVNVDVAVHTNSNDSLDGKIDVETVVATSSTTISTMSERKVQELQELQQRNVNNRKVVHVLTSCKRINDDPKFDVTTPEGRQIQSLWNGNVCVVDTHQGSGKTFWLNQVIVDQLCQFPDQKIVFLCPFTSLTVAVAQRLRDTLNEAVLDGRLPADHGLVVRQYQEDMSTDCNILVIHPRSLRKYSFKGVTTLAMDEASAVLRQLGSWGNASNDTRLSINGCVDIMRKLVSQAKYLMLSCAQFSDYDRELLFTLLKIAPETQVIKYSHNTRGPHTPFVQVYSSYKLRDLIWADVVLGRRVAVAVRHASDVDRLNAWLQIAVKQHNITNAEDDHHQPLVVPSVGWTAAWRDSRNDSPARDVTQWLTQHNIQVLFYTNALAPGMSIDHPRGHWHRVYAYISNRGRGSDSMTISQLIGRIRQLVDPTVYMYVENIDMPLDASGDSISTRAVAAVLAANPEEQEFELDDESNVVIGIKSGAFNEVRIALMCQRLETADKVLLRDVVRYMGNASIVDELRHIPEKKDPCCWEKALLQKDVGIRQTLHLTNDELPNPDDWEDNTFPAGHSRARKFNKIANSVPPELVTKAEFRLAHSLAPAAFEHIYSKYNQLRVIQELAKLDIRDLLSSVRLQAHINKLSGKTHQADQPMRAVVAICVMIAMVESGGGDVDTLAVGLGLRDSGLLVAGAAAPALRHQHQGVVLSSFGGDYRKAYSWAKQNWKTIRTLSSRNLPIPTTVPARDNTDQWVICLQRVLKENTGMNWRTPKNGTKFQLKALSIWSKLGISVPKYIKWLRSPASSHFGIIQKTTHNCDECNGCGDDVQCLRQANVWKCICPQSQYSWPHRQPFTPLDVESTWLADEEQDEKHHEQGCSVDKLLACIGIMEGTRLNQPGLTLHDMKTAWSKAFVAPDVVEDLLMLYNIDIESALVQRSNTKSILLHVNSVLRNIGLQLVSMRRRNELLQQQLRRYYLVQIPQIK
jgi:hypothetical protein